MLAMVMGKCCQHNRRTILTCVNNCLKQNDSTEFKISVNTNDNKLNSSTTFKITVKAKSGMIDIFNSKR